MHLLRLIYFTIACSVIPIGLIARRYRGDSDLPPTLVFVTDYLGDTLWAVMFFFLFAAGLVRWRTSGIAGLTLGFTLAIEFSQLYQGEPLKTLRSFPPTGFLLGSTFLWTDVACLLVGTALAVTVHQVVLASQLGRGKRPENA